MRFFILFFGIIKLSSSIPLNCTFDNHDTVYQTVYSCIVQNLHTTLNDRSVTEIVGTHKYGKSNDDVKQVFVKFQNVPYLPLNLGKFFQNLETLYVMKSNVQHLMNGDLDGLNKLKTFDVSHNPVEQIGEEFFKGQKTIERISFYDCHIKKVNRGALDDLTNLNSLFFDQNPCIDTRYDGDSSYGSMRDGIIEEVTADIYDKCHGMDHSLRTNQTELCHEIKNVNENLTNDKLISKNDKVQESSSNWSTVLTILLVFTMLLNIIFSIVLVRIVRNNFNGSWHEMKNVLV
ncbi:hypothetical protein ACKWTF_006507 [Chironomus riparius]